MTEAQDRFVWRVNAHRINGAGKKLRTTVQIVTFTPQKAKELFRKTAEPGEDWTIDAVEKVRKVPATEPMRGKANITAQT